MDQIREKRKSVLCINMKDAGYWLLLVFLTLPHMKPAYLAQFPAVDLIIDILRGASFLAIVFWYVIKRKSVSLVIVLVAVWQTFLVYSTLMHKGEVYNCLVTAFSILSVMLLYDVAYNYRKETFLSAQLFCFELIIYINLMTELIYPDGLYSWGNGLVSYNNNWFLGLYNTHTRYYFPALLFAWLYKEATGKKIRAYAILAAIWVASIRVWSGGTILSLGIMVVAYVFLANQTRIFNYYNYWALHILFFVFVIMLKLQNYFIWLLDDVLGKWGSLISRMNLWDSVIRLIQKSPIIGHGIVDDVTRSLESGVIFGGHAHNMLLELLYQGGIINLILWGAIVIVAGRKLYKYRDSNESKIIATAFLGWCVHTLVEPFTTPFLMGMFVIAYRSNRSERIGNVGEHLPEVVR